MTWKNYEKADRDPPYKYLISFFILKCSTDQSAISMTDILNAFDISDRLLKDNAE